MQRACRLYTARESGASPAARQPGSSCPFLLPLARGLDSARVEPRSLAPHFGEPGFGLRRAEFRRGEEAEAGRCC